MPACRLPNLSRSSPLLLRMSPLLLFLPDRADRADRVDRAVVDRAVVDRVAVARVAVWGRPSKAAIVSPAQADWLGRMTLIVSGLVLLARFAWPAAAIECFRSDARPLCLATDSSGTPPRPVVDASPHKTRAGAVL